MAGDREASRKMILACVESDISRVKHLYQRFHFNCRTCKAPLPFDDSKIDACVESWILGAKTIPPTTQISAFECPKCSTATCVGCGGEPKIDKDGSYWSPIGVVNNCCDLGRLWGVWLILRRFDIEVARNEGPIKSDSKLTLSLTKSAASKVAKTTSMQKPSHKLPHHPPKPSGIGYADDGDYLMDEDYDSDDDPHAFSAEFAKDPESQLAVAMLDKEKLLIEIDTIKEKIKGFSPTPPDKKVAAKSTPTPITKSVAWMSNEKEKEKDTEEKETKNTNSKLDGFPKAFPLTHIKHLIESSAESEKNGLTGISWMAKNASIPKATIKDPVVTGAKEYAIGNDVGLYVDDMPLFSEQSPGAYKHLGPLFDFHPHSVPPPNPIGVGIGGGALGASYFPASYSSGLSHLRRPTVQDPNILDSMVSTTLYLLIGFLQKPLLDGEASLLRLSYLLDRLKEMARNDSIDDITKRQNVYNAMYAFISHLVEVGLPDLVCNNSTAGLGLNGFEVDGSRLVFGEKPQASRVASWVKCNQNTYDQAVFLMNLAARPDSSQGAESLRICETLIRIHRSLLNDNLATRPTGVITSLDSSDSWNKFWKDNKLTFTEGVLNFHRLFNPRSVPSATPSRGRLNTIHKELANMRTSLPEGVFVKVDEARTDVLKVLIVGVEGTPYAGGLFPFDLLLGDDYPVSPPKMSFVLDEVDQNGTGMNPNLHVGGQVCLSLLNTWSGSADEMWQPNKSTILAVLVSVQAMILGAVHPWENEPGPEFRAHTAASDDYTLMVQCKTVKYGMISWLRERDNQARPYHTDIWKDVSTAYWKHNGEKVLKNVRAWAQTNDRLSNYTPDISQHAANQRRLKGKKKAVAGEDLITALASLIAPESIEEEANLKREAESADANKTKRRKTSSESTKDEPLKGRWVYTGTHKMADIREACEELGIRPTNSIQKSIDRLEAEVNDYVEFPEEVRKWGKFVTDQ